MGLPRTHAAAKALAWAVAERALKTALYVLLGSFGTGALLTTVDWPTIGLTVATATLLSVVGSLLSALDDGNPSLGSHEVVAAAGQTAQPVGAEPVTVVPERTPDTVAREQLGRYAAEMDAASADPDA